MSIVHKYKYFASFKADNCFSISSFKRMINKTNSAVILFIMDLHIYLKRELVYPVQCWRYTVLVKIFSLLYNSSCYIHYVIGA